MNLEPQKLKVLNANFQSVVNKVPDFNCLVDTERPDIIIGTESWLSPDIKDNELFLQVIPLTGLTDYQKLPAVEVFLF